MHLEVWDIKRIEARVEVWPVNEFSISSKVLVLRQRLEPLTPGWLGSVLHMPSPWVVTEVQLTSLGAELTLTDGRRFLVGPDNRSRLQYAILAGGPRLRASSELEAIWETHARLPSRSSR